MKTKTLLETERDQHSGPTTKAGVASLRRNHEDNIYRSSSAVKFDASLEPQVKPPLKWAGGKRWLVPQLAALWQPHSRRHYVEPFCGGLAAPLGLRPATAILNDINPHLINFYKHLQRGLRISIAMKNEERIFYRHRQRFNKLINQGNWQSAEAAQLFYYLNRTCFNGLCRFNQSGEFNVPFGTHKSITYAGSFTEFQPLFKKWTFTCGDIETLPLGPEDFIYADPPYDVEFTTYSAGGFGWDDQVRTAEWLAAQPGPVVLSNQATTRIVKLYTGLGFEISYLDGPRRISCTGDRSTAREVLAVKGLT
ncbi:MAG TPA: Dam family site-specific DNA-(adenine-N6)-methyltransferase [Pyrinomonadaceae bacterium]|nr:Dam family site-specific DNA-(adenine-N6)-methyltransferase [Pyrinomonadaceae bacterium]